ncbi:hypothetical protein G7054_g9126 [Neopestalotiopsis clavispora]|nr:hypothetical protein G7054_g9126 [Neopestalotiopsis clavispora]
MASIASHSYNMFPRREEQDFLLYDQQVGSGYISPPIDQYSPETMGFPFEISQWQDFSQMTYGGRASPGAYAEDAELRVPPSNMSTTSASSSNMGSPQSHNGQLAYNTVPEYSHNALGVNPSIVGHENYFTGTEYSSYVPVPMESYEMTYADNKPGFVDPSLIHPEIRGPMGPPMQGYDNYSQNHQYPTSPALSGATSPVPGIRNGSASPYVPGFQYSPYAVPPQHNRRPSMGSFQSPQEYSYSGDESKEKQRCPHPDCGKTFKDLKAHMLTHQTERPEKCPIQTCDYHIKGFARKYDKNRHTLTHYKGTMVCGFCPGSGSAAEKSFNRADVFKRHLTAVHGVEQTPPNSRKKSAGGNKSGKPSGYASDATGKCSTCSVTFSNAQDFYEHLDDCVLRIVQQEDPAEAVNARRLAEVENDSEVHQTLEKNSLPLTTQTASLSDEEDDEEMGEDDDEEDFKGRKSSPRSRKGNPANGVQKSRGMTHSRGGVTMAVKSKSRKNRRDYPSSWGFDKGQMTMKKRVMAVFDGPRRLAKDDMMLSTEHEVRIPLADGKYVTDLDVQTMKRAQGFLDATDEEKGMWISDDPTEDDMRKMLELSR